MNVTDENKFKILLVDDNPFELKSFEHYFKDYNLVTCLDPEIALEKINNEAFKVIILDIYMKKINGLKLYKHIKESKLNNNAYTIAYTGVSDIIVQEVIADLGFNEIVEKPANLDLLELKIKLIINQAISNELLPQQPEDLIEDRENFTYKLMDKDLNLTYKEYEIMKLLISKRGNIVSHKDIYESLYGKEERSDNIIKSHMKNLRNKIAKVDNNKNYIKTAPLKGYCLISARKDKSD